MPEPAKYTHVTYSIGWESTTPEEEYHPSKWERLKAWLLRRPAPRPINASIVAKHLAEAARAREEQLVNDLFFGGNNGH